MDKKLKIFFDFDSDNDERIEEEASFVYEDIKSLGIGEVNFDKAIDNQRDGKAVGDIIWSTINVAIVTIAGFKPLLTMLENYINKNERYSLRMKFGENELELKGLSKDEREKLINKFLDKISDDNNTGEDNNV
ncbi:MAG: hypothetical protein ABF289_09305 [Clostridiales bacterium]